MTAEQVARRYYALFNERRLDDAGELVDVQAMFHYLPTHQRLVGRAGYRALAAAWLIAFEDATVDIQSVQPLDEHTVRVTFIGRGTHTGDLELGETLVIPATGRRTELLFHDTLEIRHDRITRVEFDFDLEELKKRLSLDAAVAGHEGSNSVLVVEDDPDLRELYRTALRRAGYSVIAVDDGAPALRHVEQHCPSVVVLDLALPHVSGRDVHRELRARPRTSHIPVIVVSGTDMSDLNENEFASLLMKPIDPETLVSVVENAIRRNRPNPV